VAGTEETDRKESRFPAQCSLLPFSSIFFFAASRLRVKSFWGGAEQKELAAEAAMAVIGDGMAWCSNKLWDRGYNP
jgi:hypothetical protein